MTEPAPPAAAEVVPTAPEAGAVPADGEGSGGGEALASPVSSTAGGASPGGLPAPGSSAVRSATGSAAATASRPAVPAATGVESGRGAAPPQAAATGEASPARPPKSAPTAPRPDPETTAEVFRQLKLHLSPGTRHAVIQLQPAELGRIAIRISVRGGKVTGEIRADSAATLELLEAHAPELRAVLAQSGFDAADLSLARHGDDAPRRSPVSAAPVSEPGDRPAPLEGAAASVTPVLRHDRVDTYA